MQMKQTLELFGYTGMSFRCRVIISNRGKHFNWAHFLSTYVNILVSIIQLNITIIPYEYRNLKYCYVT
jgi:hypothetical protein